MIVSCYTICVPVGSIDFMTCAELLFNEDRAHVCSSINYHELIMETCADISLYTGCSFKIIQLYHRKFIFIKQSVDVYRGNIALSCTNRTDLNNTLVDVLVVE